MSYTPTIWVDQSVATPDTYNFIENPDGTKTLVEVTGDVYAEGTPVNASNLNKIETELVSIETNKVDKASVVNNTVTTVEGTVLDGRIGKTLQDGINTKMVDYGNCTTYSASATYAVGAYVIYSNLFYRCTTAITVAEAWNASKWTAVTNINNGTVYNTSNTAFYGIRGADSVAKKLGSGVVYLGTALTYDLKTNYSTYGLAPTDYMFLTVDNFIVGMTSGVARFVTNGIPDTSQSFSVGSSFSKAYDPVTGVLTITKNNGGILVAGYGTGSFLYSDCGNFIVFISFS